MELLKTCFLTLSLRKIRWIYIIFKGNMASSQNEIVLWARRYIGLTCERLHLPWLRLQKYLGEAPLPSVTLFLKYGGHGQKLKCTMSNCELVTGGFGRKRSVASEHRIVFSHRRKVRLPSGPDSLSWDQADSGRRVKSVFCPCKPSIINQLSSNTLRSKIPRRFLFQGHVYALDCRIYGKMIKLI